MLAQSILLLCPQIIARGIRGRGMHTLALQAGVALAVVFVAVGVIAGVSAGAGAAVGRGVATGCRGLRCAAIGMHCCSRADSCRSYLAVPLSASGPLACRLASSASSCAYDGILSVIGHL